MTAPGGRRSGRRVLSWVLAIALLGVIGFVVLRERDGDAPEPPALTTVTGVIGSEKVPFFNDPRVQEVFRAGGLDVRVDPAGSRQIATTVQLDNYDFAFPSSSPAADKLLSVRPAARTYAPYSSPMAVATFTPIVDLLTQAGVVGPDGTTFDVRRYLEIAEAGTRWDQLPGNTAFPARRDVLLSTTAPCQSNSAAMYLAITSYVANADTVVADPAGVAAVTPRIQELFRDQGYTPNSTEVVFEDYLSAGMGRIPMAMIYEAQFLAEQLSPDPVLAPDARLLYPSPTVYSRHTLVPITPAGDRVGQLLTTDPQLATLAAEHGFRPTDPRLFAEVFRNHGVPEPPQLVNVVEPPSFDTLEEMLTSLGCSS
jgi:hypothetical protein